MGAPATRAAVPAAPASPGSAASPSSLAPALAGTFQGLVNPPHDRRDVIPPNAMGAAGPDHLVSLVNTEFGVFDKATGALLDSVPLESFWASLVTPPGEPADFPFDTRVLYDQHSGRFVAVSLDCTVSPNSWLMIAVSSTGNALGAWDKWAIDADVDGGTSQTANWADFPGVGIDAHNLYVTANMFNGTTAPRYQYSKVWVIPKAQLLSGSNPITWTEFPDPEGSLSTMQPAHVFGSPDAEYLLFEDWSPNRFRLARIDNVSGTPVWRAPVPVVVAPYPLDFNLPAAPQAGDSRGIDTADTRLWNAVYRNGFLWATHHVAAGGRTEAAWYRIDPATGTVSAQGRIGDPARWYYFPSIAVNKDDVAAICFSGSSSREYAGGFYTVLRPPYAAAEPVALLKSGEDAYFKDFGKGVNRWGDLSATVVDPADNVTFWTLQEYAWTNSPVSGVSRWGTWWGRFRPSDVPAPSGLTATVVNGVQVLLGWTDRSGNESGFRIERRRLPGGDFSIIGTVEPNATSFTDDADTGLVPEFEYSYRVQAYDSSGGSVSGETAASLIPSSSGGGGGGGCLSVSPHASGAADAGTVFSVLLLFLPAAACVWKRRLRLESSR
ncbi:MAG: hypothetical protein H6Q79_985 [Deltaproteobacteria bacterium]|nr:hypothetical protein [Deltaproteobacteria bacterium]